MEQLILHLLGDYITQSDWMALNKRKNTAAAMAHAFVYSLPFLLLTYRHGPLCWTTILWTHFLIDRFGLVRYVVWAKNFIGPYWRTRSFQEVLDEFKARGEFGATMTGSQAGEVVAEQKRPVRWNPPWSQCETTGYPPERPAWLAVWLMIVADNTLHLAINYAAIRWM